MERKEQWSSIVISDSKTDIKPSQVALKFGEAVLELNGRIGKAPVRFLNMSAAMLPEKHFNQIGANEGNAVKIVYELNAKSAKAALYCELKWSQCILGLSYKTRNELGIAIVENGTNEGTVGSRSGHKLTVIIED